VGCVVGVTLRTQPRAVKSHNNELAAPLDSERTRMVLGASRGCPRLRSYHTTAPGAPRGHATESRNRPRRWSVPDRERGDPYMDLYSYRERRAFGPPWRWGRSVGGRSLVRSGRVESGPWMVGPVGEVERRSAGRIVGVGGPVPDGSGVGGGVGAV
jgi:hypothetical protein